MNILEITGLSKSFGGLMALDNVDINVAEGEIMGLIGPNGSGKTTSINCLTGFLKSTQGKVVFRNQDITGWKPHRIAAAGMSRTFQLTGLLAKATVLDNILAGLHMEINAGAWDILGHSQRNNPKEIEARRRAGEILAFMGLSADRGNTCMSVSNYSRKRLGLAMALATQPRMILVDEVVSGLSNEETESLMGYIQKINASGVTILIIEHNMKLIMKLCDRITVLNNGVKIAEGTPGDISNNADVQEAYLGVSDA